MFVVGIICGVLAAVFSSVYYLLSRTASKVAGYDSVTVFGLSHAWMGLFSLALLPLLWPAHLPPWRDYAPAGAMALGFYLLGQASLFRALHHAEASRVSPMLGLKIIMLALCSVLVLHQHLAGIQMVAAALSVVAALLLNLSGQRLSFKAWRSILMACLFYSLSDTGIGALIRGLGPETMGTIRAPLLACCFTFACGGLLVVVALRPGKWPTWQHWYHSLRLGAAWFGSMIFLYVAFGLVGVLLGAMLQSTRGLISIGMGHLVARLGHHHLESHAPASVVWRRVASGLLMFVAIALYLWGRGR